MSHFYGTVSGAGKTNATRRGHKSTGLTLTAASWNGAVVVHLSHCEETGRDMFEVYQTPWQGVGVSEPIARGIVGEARPSDLARLRKAAE